jgi:hypothetical protein
MRYALLALAAAALAAPASAQFDPRPTAGSPAASGAAFSHPRVSGPFFTPTAYRGAFAAGGTRWDLPWASYGAQFNDYGSAAGATVLEGNITTNRTLGANSRYLLRGFVRVQSGVTLTIEPGAIVFGETATTGTLVVERGGRIEAEGSEASPIVFTSPQAPGARTPGDWGGIIIAGRATINLPGGEATLEGGTGTTYGGGATPNDDDDSGTLRYVRIEFAGIAFSPNNEVNCLTMGGVGRATTIEYVQCAHGNDDSFEWFGGTVSARYLVSWATLDDDFDGDNGWSGNVQWGLIVREAGTADISGSNGFEQDNDASGSTATPRTAATFSNVTVLGPETQGGTVNPNYRRGAHLRRSATTSIFNSVIVGFPTGALLDGANVAESAGNGALVIRNTLISGPIEDNVDPFDAAAYFAAQPGNQVLATAAEAGIESPVVASEPVPPALAGFALAVSPNPVVTGAVALRVELPEARDVRLAIYDVLGREVAVVADGFLAAGAQTLRADLGALGAGVYVVRLETSKGAISHRVVVAR